MVDDLTHLYILLELILLTATNNTLSEFMVCPQESFLKFMVPIKWLPPKIHLF